MVKETKLDIIELTRGYIGVALLTWWGYWSSINYGTPFVEITSFFTTFGGIIK